MKYALAGFLVMLSFWYPSNSHGGQPIPTREIMFIIGAFFLSSFGVELKGWRKSLPWLCVLSFFLIWDFRSNAGIMQAFCLSAAVILFGTINRMKRNRFIEWTLAAICAVESIFIIAQGFGYCLSSFLFGLSRQMNGVTLEQGSFPVMGTLENPSISVVLVAATAPFLARFHKKIGAFWLIIPFCAIYLCNSSMGWISFVLGLMVFFWQEWFGIVLIFAPFAGFAAVKSGLVSISSRDFLYSKWAESVEWLGNGLGWFYDKFSLMYPHQWYTYRQEHSFIMTAISVFGIFGAVLIVYLIEKINRKISDRERPYLASFCAIFVNSLFNLTFNVPSLVLIGLISYSMITRNE